MRRAPQTRHVPGGPIRKRVLMQSFFFALVLTLALFTPVSEVSGTDRPLPSGCKRCAMLLDPALKKFSVTVAEGMERSSFDDIGCALLWRDAECAMRTSAFDNNARVYDFHTEEAVPIEKAFFAVHTGTRTPMGYDIAAFKNKDEAARFVKEKGQGQILTFNQACSLKLH